MKEQTDYQGFEQGQIRPPSEADSLLIRVTRNCPWNHCTFCPVYKGSKFSLRSKEHVIKDIDAAWEHVEKLRHAAGTDGMISHEDIRNLSINLDAGKSRAFYAAIHWLRGGMKSIFIQDANSLVIKPSDLIEILKHLKMRFPFVERITSYARSQTIAKIKDSDLEAIHKAGLNRIHIGMESGSDKVLERVKKGTSKQTQIKAGVKIKRAGMELSEYVMPGLGGQDLSKEHALETADALNQINADFIRLRTLAIPDNIPLFAQYESGAFKKCTDFMMAEEILLFIDNLSGIGSMIKSDHILNLFQEIEGKLPEDKAYMTGILHAFIDMPSKQRYMYQAGRRLGIFSALSDMEDLQRMAKVESICQENNITEKNADQVIDELMRRFI
ncbi:radical SAM protein [Desulfobacterales bacterium HSG16]|nr:radical SAM protein [Desulfobacterales bacterium HSG16]